MADEKIPAAAQAAPPAPSLIWQARTLLRAARAGTLATSVDGQPFVSLVTPACAPDLSVLLLLSELSEHTAQLRAEPRCALLVTGEPAETNPQTAPRLAITGTAETIVDPALKARWVARHPYAAFYSVFTDFSLWRIRPTGGSFVGGFARASRLRQSHLTPDPDAVAAMLAAEAAVIADCNAQHPALIEALGTAAGGGAGWRMSACDVDGCDLAREEAEVVARIAFAAPLADPQAVPAALRQALQGMTGNGAMD